MNQTIGDRFIFNRKTFFAGVLVFVSLTTTFAANPSAPFSPSANVVDPNCLPTDSNCYVSMTNMTFTSATTSKLVVNNYKTPTSGELITNGTFTGGTTGWTLGDCATYNVNNVVVTYTTCTNPNIFTTFSTTAGNTYLLTFTISGASKDTVYYYLNNNGNIVDDGPFTNGTNTAIFTTNFTGIETITFESFDWKTAGTWTIDNVSIKEIPAVSQALTVTGPEGTSWLSLGGNLLANTILGRASFSSNTTGRNNTAIGTNSLFSNTTGDNNTANGFNALKSNVDGFKNTAIGGNSLFSNISGSYNVANGFNTLYFNVAGHHNIANGYASLYNNTTGSYNIANGTSVLYNNTTGYRNTASGVYALSQNTTGYKNTANGSDSLFSSTSGYQNTANGTETLYSNSTGYQNTAIGSNSLYLNTTGYRNTASGIYSLNSNNTGYDNTANGSYALYANTTGYQNTAVGKNAIGQNTIGSNNTSVGMESLYSNIVGSNNTAIGYKSGYNTVGTSSTFLGSFTNSSFGVMISSSTAIGVGATIYNNNSMVLGGTGANTVDIVTGTSTPWAKLSIQNTYGSTTPLLDIATTTSAAYATSSIFRVNANGNVSIGTTTSNYILTAGNASVAGVVARFQNSTGYCDINPTTTSLTCTSDERLKKNILDIGSTTLDKLTKLRPVTYNWLSESSTSSPHAGLIAQEVESLFPDLVSTDDSGTKSVAYGGFIPYIIQSIRSLSEKVLSLGNLVRTHQVETDTLCVGQTCLTEDQVKSIMNYVNVSPVSALQTTTIIDQSVTSTTTNSSTATTTIDTTTVIIDTSTTTTATSTP